jgi:hypothetical protein
MSIFLNGPKIISLCLIRQYLVWIWYSESLVQKNWPQHVHPRCQSSVGTFALFPVVWR